MRAYNHLPLLFFFSLVIMLFVQATSEDLLTPDQPLPTDTTIPLNDTPSIPQEIPENEITGEVIAEEPEAQNDQQLLDPLPTTSDDPLSDTEPSTPVEKLPDEQLLPDDLAQLQPQLPGPKPEPSGGDTLTERGPYWERICTEDSCSHTLYSQQAFYQDSNNQWIPFDESFYSTPCASTYAFCVTDNLYQVHMQSYIDLANSLRFTYQDLTLHFTPAAIQYSNQQQRQSLATVRHSPSQVSTSRAQYPGAFASGIDLQFTYYPRLFKEELILQNRQALPAVNLPGSLEDISFTFSSTFTLPAGTNIYVEGQLWNQQTPITTQQPIEFRTTTTSAYLTPPLAYDALGITTKGTYLLEREGTSFTLTTAIPYLWLTNPRRAYPIHIDPTITLDYNNILWDGTVVYDSAGDATWSRNGVGTALGVGDTDLSPNPGFAYSRSDIDWDTRSIPDLIQIENMQLNLYFEYVHTSNDDIRFYPMAGGNDYYADDDAGNSAFYDDMGDGTAYTQQQATVGSITFNITNASQNLQTSLVSGADNWSIGIRSEESGNSGDNASYFTSSEGVTSANRPTLEIIYKPFATETEGDIAIDQAIVNALGTNTTMATTQQVYIYSSTGTHHVGTFDTLTSNMSKRWLVSYITSGEEFLNVQNMSTAVYSLELQNLTASQITSQVQSLIQGTA